MSDKTIEQQSQSQKAKLDADTKAKAEADAQAKIEADANLEKNKNVETQKQLETIKQELDVLTLSVAETKKTPQAVDKKNIQEKIKSIEPKIQVLKDNTQLTEEEKKSLAGYEKELADLKAEISSGWEKAWEWTKEQGEDVFDTQQWKDHPGKNLLRAGLGAGILYGGYKLISGLFGSKDKKEASNTTSTDQQGASDAAKDDNKEGSSWRKWLLGGGALTAGGYGLYRFLTGNRELSFDDSLIQAEADLGNIPESDAMSLKGGHISYNEPLKQIQSYDLGTKIDKGGWFSAKKIEGLDIKFSDYKQLIHAANLVNYIKHTYTGRCKEDVPFHSDSVTGDIYINIKKGNNAVDEKEVISGGMFSTLAKICPDLLNGMFTDTKNKEKFLAYLNKLGIWKEGTVGAPDPRGDKIQAQMNLVYQEIVDTKTEFDPLGTERGQIITTPENTDKTAYTVQSRGTPSQETKITIEADATGAITGGKIDGLSIAFTTTKELLRTANLVNKLKYQYSVAEPLHMEPGKEVFYRTSSYGLVGFHPGVYVDDSTPLTTDTRVVKKETLENLLPTVFANKDVFISYLNGLKRPDGRGLREK